MINYLEAGTKSLNYIWTTAIILVLFIGFIDYISGYEYSFSIFYLIPVIWATWNAGRWTGILISVFSTITWIEADLLAKHLYSQPFIPYRNGLVRFGVFITVALLLAEFKKSPDREHTIAGTDHLTQVSNLRSFFEAVETEKKRARRYNRPFTMAYLDLDDFKSINDQLSHRTGDLLLQKVSAIMKEQVRQTDIVGRLGGDEFAILLPETNLESARDVLKRLQNKILQTMRDNKWKVTLSMESITYKNFPDSVDEIIRKADDLMYLVKKEGKNNIRFREN
ncbi:MAG: GGDEF domain-containing protein [Calditrichota bacterium]